jgi:hypothetical protein
MSNDGLRVVIERRGSDLYWSIVERGVEHTGISRGPSFEDCGVEINRYRTFQDLGLQFKKRREARAAGESQ